MDDKILVRPNRSEPNIVSSNVLVAEAVDLWGNSPAIRYIVTESEDVAYDEMFARLPVVAGRSSG